MNALVASTVTKVSSIATLWVAAEILSHGAGDKIGLGRLWNDFKRLTARLFPDEQSSANAPHRLPVSTPEGRF